MRKLEQNRSGRVVCETIVMTESQVSAKAGEIARETAGYRCQNCNQEVLVLVGHPIQACSDCGKESFDTGWLRRSISGSPILVRAESQTGLAAKGADPIPS